jgi:hypothetical protein
MVDVLVEGYHAKISLFNLRLSPVRRKTALEHFDTKRGGYCKCYKKAERLYTTVASRIVNIRRERDLGFRIVCSVYRTACSSLSQLFYCEWRLFFSPLHQEHQTTRITCMLAEMPMKWGERSSYLGMMVYFYLCCDTVVVFNFHCSQLKIV